MISKSNRVILILIIHYGNLKSVGTSQPLLSKNTTGNKTINWKIEFSLHDYDNWYF